MTMGQAIIGAPTPIPTTLTPFMVEIKQSWSGDWQMRPDIQVESVHAASAGHDLDRCTLALKYGRLKHPYEKTLHDTSARTLTNSWVQLRLVGTSGSSPVVWIGRISGQANDPWGPAPVPLGIQKFVAYGPLQILRKIHVSTSFWDAEGEPAEIQWLPPMNERKSKVGVLGNRTSAAADGACLYGGKYRWSHLDYIRYLLKNFADEENGPQWTVTGQLAILDKFKQSIHWGTSATLAEMLTKLIPTKFGVDYTIRPSEDGFQLYVFSLAAKTTTYEEGSLPANPNVIRIVTGLNPAFVGVRIVETNDHGYGRVRVLGKRIVICGTLSFDTQTLEKKWDDGDEQAYKSSIGSDDGFLNDEARKQDKLKPVFQAFGAPDDWFQDSWGIEGDTQNVVRLTLSWVPLQVGVDYTKDPPVDPTPDEQSPEFLHPMAWLEQDSEEDDSSRWTPVGKLDPSVGVSALKDEWGVQLQTAPNHNLALNHWEAAKPTDLDPLWDYVRITCTIALESDQRLMVEKAMSGGYKPSDGTLIVEVPEAECWKLAPGTFVGVDEEGQPLRSPSELVELRSDEDYLEQVLAGVIARYQAARVRGEIAAKGLWPWTEMIGSILEVVSDGGSGNQVKAPITSVSWTSGEDPSTMIRTGYAG